MPEALTTETTPAPQHPPLHASRRTDGWSGARQAAFLEHIADGINVDVACRMVGLSSASAYSFRRRAAGAAFALGWRAAALVARDKVADDLMVRAQQGQSVTITRADGSEVVRHLYDNRLAMQLLARLDRQAEDAAGADARATRLVAGEFDAFLALIARDDAAPARAGLFLARRLPSMEGSGDGSGDAGAAGSAGDCRDLAPVLALAACDRFARTGAATAGEVAIADLDLAGRAAWSAEQWQRAEAAGLLALAAPPQLSQRSPERDADAAAAAAAETAAAAAAADQPVWWCDLDDCWKTYFPPTDDFDGEEDGELGQDTYERTLTAEETRLVEAARAPETDEADRAAADARDRWFGVLAAQLAEASAADGEASEADGPSVMRLKVMRQDVTGAEVTTACQSGCVLRPRRVRCRAGTVRSRSG